MDANLTASLAVMSDNGVDTSARRRRGYGVLAGIRPLRAAAPNARFASSYVSTFLNKTTACTLNLSAT